jgi:uncharacterized protein YacL
LRFSPLARRKAGLCGLLGGAALAALLMQPLRLFPGGAVSYALAASLYAVLVPLGWRMGTRLWTDEKTSVRKEAAAACPKILDTSVIIDGRVLEISRTGFLEGDLVVPSFVLDELRHIADSADTLRRARGRRGLDMLRKMQEELGGGLRVEDVRQEDETAEVDVRLLRLAMALGGAVMTNDYNLNKVAGVAGVPVLNVNELAGALRPAVLPGEEMTVHIVREGKEPGQGVAYLDDGTMVVVENGRRHVGETLDAEVTTVLQTSAGRMIFGRVKLNENRAG